MTTTAWKKTISLLGIISIVTIQLSPLASVQVFALDEGTLVSTTTDQSQTVVQSPTLSDIPLLGSVPKLEGTTTEPTLNIATGTSLQVVSTSTPITLNSSTTRDLVSTSTSAVVSTDLTQPSSNTSTQAFPQFISSGTTTLGSLIISTTTLIENPTTTPTIVRTPSSPNPSASSTEATSSLPNGTTTITTGNAVALANILNIVNTNLINSTGSIILANMFDGHNGDIDLRPGTSSEISTCTLTGCNGIDSITAKINADAIIGNTIALVASAGGNDIATAEHAVITTGNTLAGLNLVNVANTNLIDSTYFLLSLNSFNTINGDIVLPSLSSLIQGSSMHGPQLHDVALNSSATVANNLEVQAVNSGNTDSNSALGLIRTGDAKSSTNIFNNINSTLIGGSSASLFLKVSGIWSGQLFGLPTGTAFVEDGKNHILQYENGLLVEDRAQGAADISSTSTAAITNDVKVKADGGNNHTKDTDSSVIQTGKSLASANIINIANSTIIGRNWILAIINIFGDLKGNITFGKPDLWVGEEVSADSPNIENGVSLNYKITTKNNGDSSASNVIISSHYDREHLTITESSIPYTEENGVLKWSLGSFNPNDRKQITFKAIIKDILPGTDITNTASALGYEPDNNLRDNKDTTTITSRGRSSSFEQTLTPIIPVIIPTVNPIPAVPSPAISITSLQVERLSASTTIIGNNVEGEQVIVIRNLTSHLLPAVTLRDMLYDTAGVKKQSEFFDLGDILANEEITVSYKVSFGLNALGGKYTLATEVEQEGQSDLIFSPNGFITYNPYLKKVATPLSEINAITFSTTTGSTRISGVATIFAYPKYKSSPRIKREGTVLGAMTQSFMPATVYAYNGQNSTTDTKNTNNLQYSFGSMFLFLLISLMRMYRTHLTGM